MMGRDYADEIKQLADALQQGAAALPVRAGEIIASEYAARHAEDMRYVGAMGRWYWYGDGCWHEDTKGLALLHARRICREVAADLFARDPKKEGVACAIASWKMVSDVERLARVDDRLAIGHEELDAADWLVNMGEGLTEAQLAAMPGLVSTTVDLSTGIERAPTPKDLLTKRTACRCAPDGTEHPLWSRFLLRVTRHDQDLINFLQRWAGYCLTGSIREHKMCFLYGTGANGKSTFVNTIAGILCGYCVAAPTASFVAASGGEQHPTDLARLRGARLVTAMETGANQRWNEARIKLLTGGDKIAARFMRQDFFEYDPKFKLMISGNHRPRLGNIDEAIKRRLLLVPFTVEIPVTERDPELPEKLKAEWPAILRWMVNGCFKWQHRGLDPPAALTDATAEYIAAQDTVQHWIDECLIDSGTEDVTRTLELFQNWTAWCEGRNYRPGSMQRLSETLTARGYKKGRNKDGKQGFCGLCPLRH
jgi:putative DNA primase/helicase